MSMWEDLEMAIEYMYGIHKPAPYIIICTNGYTSEVVSIKASSYEELAKKFVENYNCEHATIIIPPSYILALKETTNKFNKIVNNIKK